LYIGRNPIEHIAESGGYGGGELNFVHHFVNNGNMKEIMQRRVGRTAIVALFMLVLAVIQAQALYISSPKPPSSALFLGVPYFIILYNLLWAGLYAFMDRFSLALLVKSKKAVWIFQFLAGIIVSSLHISLVYLLLKLFASLGIFLYWSKSIHIRGLFSDFITYNFILYAMMAGFIYLREFSNLAREKNRKTLELESQLSKAQLLSLKMQLHPHFLFNTLNTISGYIREDPEKAVDMITLFSDLLRTSLRDRNSSEITLEEELDFVFKYLEIEQFRFPDRLEVHREIDQQTLSCLVPPMLLQPIVENAVRHGIAHSIQRGMITIRAEKKNDELQISVSDNGRGFPSGGGTDQSRGIGLRNTRERLERMYGTRHHFLIQSRPGEGVTVQFRLPCRPGGMPLFGKKEEI
jgi:sensor histidine kinase YesM